MASFLRVRRGIPISPKRFQPIAWRNFSSTSRFAEEEDQRGVWKLENIESTYWNEYIATRPKYDSAIFDPLLKYHEAGSNSFKGALDIATGSGSALPGLLSRFQRVEATDNDPTSLAFAQSRFADVSSSRLGYTLSKGEDLGQHFSPSSFDLVSCALSFPLLDTQQALKTISTLLRPAGTLAIMFYGPPFFADPTIAKECQPLIYALVDHAFKPVVSGQSPEVQASWKQAADGMASWLDYVPFSSSSWKDVQRNKWNTEHARLAFFGQEACDFPVEPVSSVTGQETVTEKQDPGFWRVEWDFNMVKRFVLAVFPRPADMAGPDPKMDALFEQLKEAMGGSNVKRQMSWPAVLVLARKQS